MTDAGRHVLKRLCKEAGIELDDGAEYLTPHGARRGAGKVSRAHVRDRAVTRVLDNSEGVVREHYSHIEASGLTDQMTSAFKEENQKSESGSEQE